MNAVKPLVLVDVTVAGELSMVLLGMRGSQLSTRKHTFRFAHGSSFLEYFLRYLSACGLDENLIRGVALIEGKGSFSAARSAVAVLNILRWTSGVSIAIFDCRAYSSTDVLYKAIGRDFCARSKKRFISPIYQGEPNIRTLPPKALSRAKKQNFAAEMTWLRQSN